MSDLIDRQTAIDEILRLTSYDTVRSLYEATVANKYEDCYEDGLVDAIDVIVGLPSAQPKQKIEELLPDGTLHLFTNADLSKVGRVLISQNGTHYGGLYYADGERSKE